MNRILILTKNVLAEQQLQKQLQLLDYEVFCSTEVLRNEQMHAICDYFPIILLSETISNLEMERFLPNVNQTNNLVIRSVINESDEEELRAWKEFGIVGGLSKSLSFDGLREKLVELQNDYYDTQFESNSTSCSPISKLENRTLETSYGRVHFSKKEERLFKLLLEAKGVLLPRSEICEVLWSEGETDSNRSQLSCIATKIKNKFKDAGYQGDTIITKWGQGYGLDLAFYNYLTTGRGGNGGPEFLWDIPKLDHATV